MAKRTVVEAPSTPGRPVFSFSIGSNGSRKSFPSKWDDAEKWLIGGHDSPASHHIQGLLRSADGGFVKHHETEVLSEKSRVTEEKVSKAVSIFQGQTIVSLDHHHHHHHHNSATAFNDSSDVLLKDKFTNPVEPSFPRFKCSEPMSQGFVFKNSMKDAATEVVHEVKCRDIGTEMTPLGSSTTSRCPTPFASLSPPRHTTPASKSGLLAMMDSSSSLDMGELQECHLAKLQLGAPFDPVTSNWSSREEEEEDISKSLRHFEVNSEGQKNISEPRPCAWEVEENTKCCQRYQIEEAKIQAWVNLQNAKAEAQSRKLEVKIQKMRLKLEEKLTRKMGIVHKKAEVLRAAAKLEHTEHLQKASNRHHGVLVSGHGRSCGCFHLHP